MSNNQAEVPTRREPELVKVLTLTVELSDESDIPSVLATVNGLSTKIRHLSINEQDKNYPSYF